MGFIGDIQKQMIIERENTAKYLVVRYDDDVVIDYKQFDTLQDAYDWCSDLYDDLINDYKIELGKLFKIYKCTESVYVGIKETEGYAYTLEFVNEEK